MKKSQFAKKEPSSCGQSQCLRHNNCKRVAAQTDNHQAAMVKDQNAQMELRKDHAKTNNHQFARAVLNHCAAMDSQLQDQSQRPVKWRNKYAKTSLPHPAKMDQQQNALMDLIPRRLNAKPPGSVTTRRERCAKMVNSQEFCM